MTPNYERVAEFMRDLSDTIAQEAKATLHLSEERAAEFGMSVAQKACEEYAGQILYVPMGLLLQISARDRELYAFYKASGRDANATSKRFECSVQTVYKRVRLIEVADFNARQGGLFEAPNE